MKRFFYTFLLCCLATTLYAQELAVQWEHLTSPEMVQALDKSGGVCIIPMGVIEKHGPHMPLGTDVLIARDVAIRAAQEEYAVVFPFYFVGQINEARHQPGTVSYSPELLYQMLDETCREIARNGFKKIILYNYHGGNTTFLKYFCQSQLASEKDYIVYNAEDQGDEYSPEIMKFRVNIEGGHADEGEGSNVMTIDPSLVKPERAHDQSGESLERLPLPGLYTGIWWYANYPNHYAGDGSKANAKLGQLIMDEYHDALVRMIRTVKEDSTGLQLQSTFFEGAKHPAQTPQK